MAELIIVIFALLVTSIFIWMFARNASGKSENSGSQMIKADPIEVDITEHENYWRNERYGE